MWEDFDHGLGLRAADPLPDRDPEHWYDWKPGCNFGTWEPYHACRRKPVVVNQDGDAWCIDHGAMYLANQLRIVRGGDDRPVWLWDVWDALTVPS